MRVRIAGRALRGYGSRDTAASLAMGLGSVLVGVLQKGAAFALYQACFEMRLFELGAGPWVLALALLGLDLVSASTASVTALGNVGP